MKSRNLKPLEFVKPAAAPVCAACKVFRPDALTPYGDGAIGCCWLCAHHIVEHDCSLETAFENECECLPTEIYPRSRFGTTEQYEAKRDEVIARRNEA